MLSEGTETRSSQEIAAAFEFMGARISAETRREITLLSTETLTKHWTDALALMADLVLHPTFPQHELDRTRREHLTDLRRAKDEPTFVAEQVMAGLVFGRESRYGHPSIGTEASTTALTREDLVRHFQDHYGPAGATLAVVGDVTLEQVMDQAKAALGNWEAGLPQSNGQPQSIEEATETETTIYLVDKPGAAQSVIRAGHATVPRQHPDYFGLTLLNYSFGGNWEAGLPQSNGQPQSIEEATETETTIYLVDKPGAAQSVIRAGHATVPRQHPDYFGLTLLNYSFGGNFSARLNQNLRQEKGYSYGYHSSVSWFREPSYMVAGGSVQTAVTKESVQETLKEFQEIHQDRPVTSEEIERAKAGMLRSYPANFERSGQIVGQIVQLVLHDLPNDYFRTISDQMAAVPLEEVHRVGDQQVRPDNLKVLVVGDRQEVEPGLRDLGLPVVLLDSDGIQVE
jgi:predicted Zn-dependent peptidase